MGVQQNIQEIRKSHYVNFRSDRSQAKIAVELQEATRTMRSRWYSLPDNSPLIGKSLEKAYIRRLTGVTLMAITRGNQEKIEYPNPETIINGGDSLLLIGEGDELNAFEQLAKGEITLLPQENDSCLWVLVPENSLVVGQTLEELNVSQRFSVSVQAIRRTGKYIRFPDGSNHIQPGDQILLFGTLDSLTQITQLISPTDTGLIKCRIEENK
jgi:CPA2 family monovalent cation:H+ antiporter-2